MRPLYTARLDRKLLLSASAQCYHLEFCIDALARFDFEAGQFLSFVAPDAQGKEQTRAYSIASAPDANRFALCVNRVENGFFSNLLCDLAEGDTLACHGPHGTFVLREPLTHSLCIATGTGIAPMRGFAQALFPATSEDRSGGKDFFLVYGTRYAGDVYYQDYFEDLAARYPNFHYVATLSRAEASWTGAQGYVQEHAARLLATFAAGHAAPPTSPDAPAAPPDPAAAAFEMHAYVCGLNQMVSASRERLKALGWHRKQIIFERYD
ncbi:ferredoxin--NADP reductase [Acidipila sp. EB88]|uniref:ferredoxin--NADP reductase n=1 Tax=Acidipila sp. EB88 TaxID=2305226 RepID=UPI000F5E0BB8|nr:FAD-dependent oxidoreductase [Acidipila sp. EB88]RRA48521.1 FAD-dependent oxidoreductase [Acidipila sp. EB88]